MRIKHLLFVAALALAATACDQIQGDNGAENITLYATVTETGSSYVNIKVIVEPSTSTFFETIIPANDYNYADAASCGEVLVALAANKVALGAATWVDYLNIGSREIAYADLEPSTAYKIVLFGLSATGKITSDVTVLDVTTAEYVAPD